MFFYTRIPSPQDHEDIYGIASPPLTFNSLTVPPCGVCPVWHTYMHSLTRTHSLAHTRVHTYLLTHSHAHSLFSPTPAVTLILILANANWYVYTFTRTYWYLKQRPSSWKTSIALVPGHQPVYCRWSNFPKNLLVLPSVAGTRGLVTSSSKIDSFRCTFCIFMWFIIMISVNLFAHQFIDPLSYCDVKVTTIRMRKCDSKKKWNWKTNKYMRMQIIHDVLCLLSEFNVEYRSIIHSSF